MAKSITEGKQDKTTMHLTLTKKQHRWFIRFKERRGISHTKAFIFLIKYYLKHKKKKQNG